MAEECVVELCRQPALPAPVTIEVGNVRLELPLCAVHVPIVQAEMDWLNDTAIDRG